MHGDISVRIFIALRRATYFLIEQLLVFTSFSLVTNDIVKYQVSP